VESEPGQGTVFTVKLPQAQAGEKVLGPELAENLRCFKLSLTANRHRSQIVRDPMPYGKVLVVDDVETNIYVAAGLLKLYDLQTDTAESGAEALDKIRAGKVYDIVFMDHMMPVMDGIETTKHMRAMGYGEPIVALTANAVAKQSDMFLQSGFDDFIAKPIDVRQLNAVLNRLVRDKQPPEVIAAARSAKRAQPAGEDAGPDPMLYASFVRDGKKALAILEQPMEGDAVPEERVKQFTITVHGMKSALANIGETRLSAEAKALELAGKANDLARIRESVPGFLEKLRELIEKAEPMQDNAETDENVPELLEKLKAIQAMCGDYDRKGATDILAELGAKKCSRRTREALERITEAVLHSEFEEAAELALSHAASLSQDAAAKIEGLDIEKGIEKFGGDKDTYYKVLRSYAASMETLLAKTESPEKPEYEIAVHGIKGASRDIFAEAVGQAAAGLEDAAKAKDLAYIQQNHEAFQQAARKLAAGILAFLGQLEGKSAKPIKDKPDTGALARLLAACELYDMDGADAAMAEIEQYEYEADGGLAAWLREKADLADFAAITQRLTEKV
jgi:CheY-like chemotaxis protein